jgi:hypothetical protein
VTDVSEVYTASIFGVIALLMEAVHTSETSVSFYRTTGDNMPEGCHLHTHCHENLKCHNNYTVELSLFRVSLIYTTNACKVLDIKWSICGFVPF